MRGVSANHLDWPDCLNVRDLGGLPTPDGRVRAGALIRSDSLQYLSGDGVGIVRAAGVSRVVDLRNAHECEAFPTPFAAEPEWRNQPVQGLDDPVAPTMARTCIAMLDQNQKAFASAVAAVAEAPPGGVVVHCHGGKDRTGLVVALVLRLLGVDDELILDDYALTAERLASRLAVQLEGVTDPVLRAEKIEMLDTRRETLAIVLDHLDERYGGAWPYLQAGGLTPAQREALVVRLTAA